MAALGEPVSVVARGATLAALQTHGLRLQQAEGLLQVPVQAADNAAALGVQDLVVVAVKAPCVPIAVRVVDTALALQQPVDHFASVASAIGQACVGG